MAERTLINLGTMKGSYAGTPFENSLSSVLEVTMAEISFEKTADQEIWFSGNLTLFFKIDNSEGEGPLSEIVVSDLLDNTKFQYIEGSMTVTYESGGGTDILVPGDDYTVAYSPRTPDDTTKDLLEIAFTSTGAAAIIPVGSIVTISFLGEKVPA